MQDVIYASISLTINVFTILYHRDSMIFRFACSQRHIMCLCCFSNYCQQMMSADNFHGFGDMGYSIGCPGKGKDCANTPVPDPHHFKIVDDDLKFVSRFCALIFH